MARIPLKWFLQLVFVDGGIGTDFFMLLSGFFSYRTWNRATSGYMLFIRVVCICVYPRSSSSRCFTSVLPSLIRRMRVAAAGLSVPGNGSTSSVPGVFLPHPSHCSLASPGR